MLTDPRFDLQKAIVPFLQGYAPLSALIGDRVFDRVPRGKDGQITASFPFVNIGDYQLLPEIAECTDAAETILTLHCWSREVGFPEVMRIAAAVTERLHDGAVPLENGTLQSLLLDSSRILRDPDGLTSHAVLTFSALTDAN